MDGLIRARDARTSETLLVAFLATIVMLFAGFTSAYLIRRTGSDWTRIALPPLAYGNALVLVGASVALERARRGASADATRTAFALGCVFLAGQVQLLRVLSSGDAFVWSAPQGAFLLLLSVVHGLHLTGGIAALAWLLHRRAVPRLTAVYWHFLGLVWLFVLLLLSFA